MMEETSAQMNLADRLAILVSLEDIDSDEFNSTLYSIQQDLDVESGDLAGIYFSGVKDNWKEMSPGDRWGFLAGYLNSEICECGERRLS